MLQDLLPRLSGLSSAELRGLKDAVNAELGDQLGTLDGLSAEEWDALDGSGFTGYRDCIKLVHARTGLGLILAKEHVDDARTKGRPAAVYDGRAKGKSAAPSSSATVENSSAGKVFATMQTAKAKDTLTSLADLVVGSLQPDGRATATGSADPKADLDQELARLGTAAARYRDAVALMERETFRAHVRAEKNVDEDHTGHGGVRGLAAPSSIATVENISAGKVFVAICHVRYSDDEITVHASRESADLQIEKFKELYGNSWIEKDYGRPSGWVRYVSSGGGNGPNARIEEVEFTK